ncbi:MAG: DUF1259 domain-containing protein [Acidobacteriota bacterium]|nr:DUF1259 domain-containing protein [Acidobacteriota bacterium]
MNRKLLAAGFGALLCSSISIAAPPPDGGWNAVDKVFGQTGKDQPGNVHKFSWPRTDLKVSIAGVPIEPALALGSWAGFTKMEGGDAHAMGDLVLLGSEVAPVVRALEKGGFEILAIHNHLIGETPRAVYVHFHGKGEPAAIAQTLKTALGQTATPLSGSAPAKPTPEQEKTFQTVQDVVGRRGNMAGRVLQLSIPRAEAITDSGMEVPPSMGMAIAVNFETVGAKVATTGDFVLIADEVNPVIRALHAHGIDATALHSHMLKETPRLFFLHFWGVDAPEKIAAGIKAALANVATK